MWKPIPLLLSNKVNFWVEEINNATAVDHVKKAVAFINDLYDLHALIKESHDPLTLVEKDFQLLKNLSKESNNGVTNKGKDGDTPSEASSPSLG